jgi:Arc/MetJ-type ribon-helix-helix transcriptional regulator
LIWQDLVRDYNGDQKETVVAITIRPEHERLIVQAIQTGAYASPDDVIERALRALRSEDEWLDEDRASISGKSERAFGQFERGEYFSPEQSRLEMERRKAEWTREHRA